MIQGLMHATEYYCVPPLMIVAQKMSRKASFYLLEPMERCSAEKGPQKCLWRFSYIANIARVGPLSFALHDQEILVCQNNDSCNDDLRLLRLGARKISNAGKVSSKAAKSGVYLSECNW